MIKPLMRKLSIGLDIDGVIYSFVRAFRKYLCEFEGRCESDLPDPTCWDFFSEQWEVEFSAFLEIYNDNPNYLFSMGGDIKPEKLEVLNKLRSEGHQIIFITSRYIPDLENPVVSNRRKIKAELYTAYWLAHNQIPYDELYVCTSGEKALFAKDLDFFVDDYWENLDEMKANNPKLTTCLYRRPYNEQQQGHHLSASSFVELYDLINSLATGNSTPAGGAEKEEDRQSTSRSERGGFSANRSS